jgi:hypothetical protein
MNENNKSFYPLDMFEFIHHPENGCCNLKGSLGEVKTISRQENRATHGVMATHGIMLHEPISN